jgi:hypothetical protein
MYLLTSNSRGENLYGWKSSGKKTLTSFCGKQQVTVGSAVVLVVLCSYIAKSLANGASAFISSEDTFAGRSNSVLFMELRMARQVHSGVHTAVAMSSSSYLPMLICMLFG